MAKKKQTPLEEIAAILEKMHGKPSPPSSPYEAILLESVGYLVDDDRRAKAFEELRAKTGLDPRRILDADNATLLAATKLGGMLPEARIDKLRTTAALIIDECAGDLTKALDGPLPQARKLLKRFPGVGDPGADYLLLLSGKSRALGPESNALRVLTRLGYGEEKKSYSATYKSSAAAIADELPSKTDAILKLRSLLRTHGQEVCKRNAPLCEACPLSGRCRFFGAK